ncbi:hypothetical protein [Egicoccus halophilus]|uniref:Uncharacterized protein n=1 Tax=Egicoccus halophilus TaxID=1670830 RepID=A0A8J3AAB4_9ACTN|nr:hypothetical protein [Egicoccus halophilus]GGI08454.1 hypothetical protein GCM10011354_29160 [Egicoccus halophilus]
MGFFKKALMAKAGAFAFNKFQQRRGSGSGRGRGRGRGGSNSGLGGLVQQFLGGSGGGRRR